MTGTRVGLLVQAAESPAETLRLLEEQCRELRALGMGWADSQRDRAATELKEGRLNARLWVGPKDEAVGFARLDEAAPEFGHRLHLYLAEGYRTAAALGAFVDRLELPGGFPPVISFRDPWPGTPLDIPMRALSPRGFVPRVRIGMRIPDDRPLPPPRPGLPTPRPVTPADEEEVARLARDTYATEPAERALFLRHRDPLEEARYGARYLMRSEIGPFLPDASFAIEVDGEIAAATLVNRLEVPLITEVMTRPRYRGRGYAGRLLIETVAAVRRTERDAPRLAVSEANPARRLYERLGFVAVPGDRDAVWLHAQRLGIPPA